MSSKVTWRVAGGSGDGIDSTSTNFAKSLMRSGYHIFTHRHYPSRIRGGHTFAELTISSNEVHSRPDEYDFLLALGDSYARNESEEAYYGNEEIKPLTENLDDLRDGGVIVYDSDLIDRDDLPEDFDDRCEKNNWSIYPIGLRSIARDNGRAIMRNTAGVGITSAIIEYDKSNVVSILEDSMGGDILQENKSVLDESYRVVSELETESTPTLPESEHSERHVLVSGDDCVSYGAVDEGVQFISGYPMTPWTGVFSKLSQILPKYGGVAEQVEDEIAACAMAVGASHAGVKAMSGSSGGGFSLMSEPLGMAEMTETPIVLLEAQRGGPSTGLPTKPEQSDLEHVLYTSQGDSCRFVVSPGNNKEAYEQTRLAFQIAYQYHLPSIILTGQKISGEYRTVPESFFDKSSNAGNLEGTVSEDEIKKMPHHSSGKFNRYQYSDNIDGDSVSPRSIPGQESGRYLASGNEHNPQGHISEDPENREKQMDRRIQKLEDIRLELRERNIQLQKTYGSDSADVGVITFGSQQGTVRDAVEDMVSSGIEVRGMGVSQLKPFPVDEVQSFLDNLDCCIVVEMNPTGQFKNEMIKNVETRRRPQDITIKSLNRYDGNTIRRYEIAEAVTKVINNE